MKEHVRSFQNFLFVTAKVDKSGRCFPVNIAKFLIQPILKNICKRLLFNVFNGSPLHGPKGLRTRLYGDVILRGSSDRSCFCF